MMQSNAEEIAHELEQLSERIPLASEAALHAVSKHVEESAAGYIQRIYDAEIPTGKNGKPRWERSGDLADGLATDETSETERTIEVQGRAAKYARPRHDLNRPGADGITRHNPFFDQAEDATENDIPAIAGDAFFDVLNA